MEVIKRHYEKLILLGVLLLFILAMIFVLSTINQSKEISDADLKIPAMHGDYEKADANSDRFKADVQIKSTRPDWQSSGVRDAALFANHFSDLVIFPGVARCPLCMQMIPTYYFSGARCPECDKTLPAPERPRNRRFEKTDSDKDGDGIPDVWEAKFKLDEKIEGHAMLDPDGDGFSTIYEFQNNTNPLVPRSHPPLWQRLKFTTVHLIKLPVRFKALTAVGEDKANWDIQLELDNRTLIKALNDTVKVLGRRYRIVDVERNVANSADQIDESKLYLVEEISGENPEKITMQIGRETFSSDQRAVLEDVSDPNFKQELRPGDVFAIGDRRTTGEERYRLVSFDAEKKIVVLENLDKDAVEKTVTVGADSVIPEEFRVQSETAAPEVSASQQK
ncbi:MAG: hypothetical protein MJ016_03090 [Victivallaceae bacterium]|nr:hypothetical protein [Victivallaceae bacterium]